jgi:orotate phosphoribosyltransferase
MFNQKQWVEYLIRCEVLKFGEFTLKDGSFSPFFLDFGSICTGQAFRELGISFCQRIEETVGFNGVDFLYGPPYKATVIAASTAMGLTTREMPCYFTRKEAKSHGEGGTSFGFQPKPGHSYLLLDDVMSSGATKIAALSVLKEQTCRAVIVGVDRQHRQNGQTAAETFTAETGVPVVSLLTLQELAELVADMVPQSQHRALLDFCGA